MPDRSEGEPPEGGAVDDGWAELLGDGDSAPAPPAVEPLPAAAPPAAAGPAESRADDAAKAGDVPADEPKAVPAREEEREAPRVEREKEEEGSTSKQLFFAPPGNGEAKEGRASESEAGNARPTDAEGEEPVAASEEADEAGVTPEEADGKEPDAAAAIVDEPQRGVFADEQPSKPLPAAAERTRPEGGSSWGFVGALVVAAALVGAWVMSTRTGDSSGTSPTNRTPGARADGDRGDRPPRASHAPEEKTAVRAHKAQDAHIDKEQAAGQPPPQPVPAQADEPEVGAEEDKEPFSSEATAESTESAGTARIAPEGTPPEIARAFESLPVTQFDRKPVGNIGASGIHIDQISMGTEYEGSRCGGQPDGFSISKRQRANVCFRVVHDRNQGEQLRVLWQKDGGTVRRTALSVPEVHAYRTRAFLVLRREYAGRWTVRIMSMDGIELAAHAFSVVE